MKFSAAGMELLKRFEGFRNRVYLDVAGLPTIGYGHRLLHSDSFPNGIDEPQAANLLACDVRDAEQAVERMVKAPLTQGQFDALVDFTFNLGAGRLASSTLLKSLNRRRSLPSRGKSLVLKEHDFTACGKTHSSSQKASGHDFSRAVNAIKHAWALAPEGCFSAYWTFAKSRYHSPPISVTSSRSPGFK